MTKEAFEEESSGVFSMANAGSSIEFYTIVGYL